MNCRIRGIFVLLALLAPWTLVVVEARAADALRITAFAPSSGPAGTVVVISGTGMMLVNDVRFAGVPASFTVNSSKKITATVPAGATTGRITAARPNATATSATDFTVTGQPESTPWPMFQHDPQHTGRTSAIGPSAAAVREQWVYRGKGWIKNQAAIGSDGTVYIGNSRFPLCALNAVAGVSSWCTTVGGFVDQSSPAIGNPFVKSDALGSRTVQTIYMGDRNNAFWAIDSEGDTRWGYKIDLDGDVRASAIIGPGPSNTVYMACGCTTRGVLHAFDPAGTLLWVVDLPQVRQSSPAGVQFGPHYRLYVVTNYGIVHAIDDLGTGGQIAWTLALGSRTTHGSPSIGADGTIYVGTDAGLFAVRDDGTSGSVRPGWPFPTEGEVDTTPAIASNGRIFVSSHGAQTRTLYAIDPTTNPPTRLWSFSGRGTSSTSLSITPSAVIGGNGLVYAAIGRDVYGFDPAAASPAIPRWHFGLGGDAISLTPGEGVLYVSAKNSRVYALVDAP